MSLIIQDISPAEYTKRRKLRAEVSKAGLAAKTVEDLDAVINHYADLLGDAIDNLTHIRTEETFRSLLELNRERIINQSPEAVAAWVNRITEVKELKDLAGFYKSYSMYDYCQTTDAEDALSAKAKEFGFASLDEYASSLEASEAKA